MEPRIQYARTKDGVNIAFKTQGSGPAYVSMPLIPWSHLELEQTSPIMARGAALAADLGRTFVTYDNRGSGLSDRDAADYSIAGHLLDLEAVVDHLALEDFPLISMGHSGPVAISYAAQHPERVSRLVLIGAYIKGSDYVSQPRF